MELIDDYRDALSGYVDTLENYGHSTLTGATVRGFAAKLRTIAGRKMSRGDQEAALRKAMKDADAIITPMYSEVPDYFTLIEKDDIEDMVGLEVRRLTEVLPAIGYRVIFDKYDGERTDKIFRSAVKVRSNRAKDFGIALRIALEAVRLSGKASGVHAEAVIAYQNLTGLQPTRVDWSRCVYVAQCYEHGDWQEQLNVCGMYLRSLKRMTLIIDDTLADFGVEDSNELVLTDRLEQYYAWALREMGRLRILNREAVYARIEGSL